MTLLKMPTLAAPLHHWLGIRFLGFLLGVAALAASAHAAERRVALVIGNSDYAVESKLANPANDAQLIARTLKSQGFAVDIKTNLPKRAMELAIAAFVRQSAGADSAVLYYAGHGAQPANGGRNYLLPVDARVEGDDTLDSDGIAADRIVEQMERSANPAKIRLVVLDACRNNRLAGKTRSGVRGLARMSPGDDFTLIAFSTNDQDVAQDGTGANSPYAQALSQHLAKANELPLRRIFELTATDVRAATNQKQRPRTYGDLDSRMLLDGTQLASLKPEPVVLPSAAHIEQQAWTAAQRANSAAAYNAYLAEYPHGSYASPARVARAGLEPAPRPVESSQQTARPATVTAGQIFKDCPDCPEMVAIPAGSFQMGSTTGDADEKPVHGVNIKSFALGKTEVTRGQFAAYVADSGHKAGNSCYVFANGKWADTPDRNWRNPGFSQSDNDPVACVNWNDAQAYVRWLSQYTGQTYRLPSEAEWEFACRGGDNQTYCGGDNVDSVAVYRRQSGDKTLPVGGKQANAWGLYDMSGNVWEWTQDCWNETYSGAPGDGSAWTTGNCGQRVLRGGSWYNFASGSRAAGRLRFDTSGRLNSYGFRLARMLP